MTLDLLKGRNFKLIWRRITSDYSHWLSFVVLMVVALIVNPGFLSWNNLSNQFIQGAIVGICAMGMSLVISAGMIDLTVGSACAFISGMGVTVLNATGSAWLCLLFCLGAGFIIGLINGILVTKGRIAPFIVTLASMSAWRSVINQLGQGGPFTIDSAIYEGFRKISAGHVWVFPNLMIFLVLITVLTSLIMTRTKFGTYVYAIGSNELAAKLSGISVDRVKTIIFIYAGTLYGLAAFFLASRLSAIASASAGNAYEMDAIAAVAIGGTSMSGGRGKIVGTFLGILMLRVITTVLIMAKVPPFLNGLVQGIIIIIAVLAQNRKK
ncbi:MAG: ABC transporter permease [Spirochaetaceae bacterium]|nr:ABC transporter permease [Spirochaetaceae bacterium]